jgi:hypothetical protein
VEQAALLASTLEQLEAAKTTAREAEEKVQQADAQRDQALADLQTAQEVRKPQSALTYHTDGMQRTDALPLFPCRPCRLCGLWMRCRHMSWSRPPSGATPSRSGYVDGTANVDGADRLVNAWLC